jgi:hypothetical protein
MSGVEIMTAELDGKRVAFSSETKFYIQVGKGRGGYRTKYAITGSLGQACLYYRAINIGNGYKKRLLMGDKKLAVCFS